MNSVDCRDRTAEFFSTIQQIQKTQQALQQNGTGGSFTNGGAFHPINDGTSHRPLPKSSFASSASYHNEFDDRPSVDERTSMLMPSTQPKQQSQFTQAAQHIGRNIHMVTEKLEKLGKRQNTIHIPYAERETDSIMACSRYMLKIDHQLS